MTYQVNDLGQAHITAGPARYIDFMTSGLRRADGTPGLRVRALALLVVVGMVVLTAPVVVLPVAHWLAHL